MLHTLEKFTVYTLDMAVLFGVSTTSPEEACAQVPHVHPTLCINAIVLTQSNCSLSVETSFVERRIAIYVLRRI